jgi:NADH-ubiquinone oxidoreductase chain 1
VWLILFTLPFSFAWFISCLAETNSTPFDSAEGELFMCCTSLGVYTVMVAGWASNSNYSLLCALRSVAPTISYEVLLFFVFLVCGYNLVNFYSTVYKTIHSLYTCIGLAVTILNKLVYEINLIERFPNDQSSFSSFYYIT